jgi:membrane-bound serine protease (ClpP class)
MLETMKRLFWIVSLLFAGGVIAAAETNLEGEGVVIRITDRELGDARRWREVFGLMEKAAAANASAVVLDINSSGVNPQTVVPLAEQVAALETRTVAWLNASAVGGAAFLALACDEIWMGPGGRIGAAPPDLADAADVSEAGQKTLLAQRLAVLKGAARSLAGRKGHRAAVAEGFVDAAMEVKLGDLALAGKGDLLLLDAEQATAEAFDGRPVMAAGSAANGGALARGLGLKVAGEAGLKTLAAGLFEKPAEGAAKTAGQAAAGEPRAKTAGKPARVGTFTGKVVRITVGEQDLITPARFEFMTRTLERCTEEGAEAVIFDLDTPGGLAWDTTNLMMRDLQKLGPPSYAYVNPRALSAGAMIALATDGIYIAPAGSVGAATPVYGGGGQMGDAERAKANSAIMGMARTVAKEKGHDPRVIEAMIDMDKELIVNGQVLSSKGQILTLDAEEAVMEVDGRPLFAKAIASDLDEVKKAEGLRGETVTAEPEGFEIIAIWVTRYAAILILIGIAGAYMEMQAPGFGLPGFISLAAFGLFFFGHYVAGSLVGHETAAAVVVFLLGLVLVGVEFFVLPGTMVAGITGFLCIAGALVYTMSGWEPPQWEPSISEETGEVLERVAGFSLATYANGLRNFALGVSGAALLLIALARYLPEMRLFKSMTLSATAGGTAGETPVMQAAAAVHPGDVGVARSALRPYGTVEIGGRQVEALVEGGILSAGEQVRVREVRGGRIIVESAV